jgi:hypothetical protein
MIIAEIDGAHVEVFRAYRCWEARQNGHFEFRFLETVPERYACFGFLVGDHSWECCRAGRFKNWRREEV